MSAGESHMVSTAKQATARFVEDESNGAPEAPANRGVPPRAEPLSISRLGVAGAAALVFLAALALNGYGLSALEFFRHTEADRTLIAWEMLESGDYLIPHLIHSQIFTKPPLYYWVLAGTMKLFGTTDEWAARLPSVIGSALLGVLQLVMLIRCGATMRTALLGSAVTLTGFSCFVMATLAEIDFLYALCTTVALYAAYLAIRKGTLDQTLIAYALVAVAFLIKGPPVVFFFAATLGAYTVADLLLHLREGKAEGKKGATEYAAMAVHHVAGALLFVGLVGIWILPLAQRVGWPVLGLAFYQEVFERVVSDARLPRGHLFYVGTLLVGLLPWTIGAAFGVAERLKGGSGSVRRAFPSRDFLTFNLVAVFTALVMLSIASNKSSRYIFPIFPFAANLVLFALLELRGGAPTRALMSCLRWSAPILAVVAAIAAVALPFSGLLPAAPPVGVAATALLGTAVMLLVRRSAVRSDLAGIAIASVLLMGVVRVGQSHVYAPMRNSERSMKPVAAEIHAALPAGAVLYHVELFDRWVSYYLKRIGRETYRLTPTEAREPRAVAGRSFLLLSADEEGWRLEQIRAADPTFTIMRDIERPKIRLLLVDMDATKLDALRSSDWFPTRPTKPFYGGPPPAGWTPLEVRGSR